MRCVRVVVLCSVQVLNSLFRYKGFTAWQPVSDGSMATCG